MAPFKVYRFCGYWWLEQNYGGRTKFSFETHAEAIAFAHERWPWWP